MAKTKPSPEAYDVNEYGGLNYERDVRPRYSPGYSARVDDLIVQGRNIAPVKKRSAGDGKEHQTAKAGRPGRGKKGARRQNN